MSCFLFVEDKEAETKIDIDELYEKRHARDLKQLSIFKKILNRIHVKIQKTARNKTKEQHLWFTVPEFIFGEPLYDQGDCIAYLVNNLGDNKFYIKYLHPNTLFISWSHWVPSYVRNEFKKKTGKIMDELGNIKVPENESQLSKDEDMNQTTKDEDIRTTKKYKPPSFIYDDDIIEKIENRLYS